MSTFWTQVANIKTQLFLKFSADPQCSVPQFLKQVAESQSDIERVCLVYDMLKKYDLFIDVQRDNKCDEAATFYRMEGNTRYAMSKFVVALRLYNKSVMCANSSRTLALAYGNRSACHFHLNLYEECIQDINRALSLDYPPENKIKLLLRRDSIINFINSPTRYRGPYSEPVPIIGANDRNPSIRSATKLVDLKYNDPRYGVHVVAAHDIKVGDILSIESPVVYQAQHGWMNCSNCSIKCYNPLPCKFCTRVIFCSDICRENGYILYHRYVCKIAKILHTENRIESSYLVALNMLIRMRDVLPKTPIPEHDKVRPHDKFYETNLWEVWQLSCNFAKRDYGNILDMAIVAAILFELMLKRTTFFLRMPNLHQRFKGLLFYLLMVCSTNCLEVFEFGVKRSDVTAIGVGMYPFSSRYNHSCIPNVVYTNYGNKLLARAIKPIMKGEQCFISYTWFVRPEYVIKPKQERQLELMKVYNFGCICIACEKNWEYIKTLNCPNHPIYLTFSKIPSSRFVVSKIMPMLRLVVTTAQEFEPCGCYVFVKSLLVNCFQVMGNSVHVSL